MHYQSKDRSRDIQEICLGNSCNVLSGDRVWVTIKALHLHCACYNAVWHLQAPVFRTDFMGIGPESPETSLVPPQRAEMLGTVMVSVVHPAMYRDFRPPLAQFTPSYEAYYGWLRIILAL
jgi:hypothetical protein